jgi:hypothetical protein
MDPPLGDGEPPKRAAQWTPGSDLQGPAQGSLPTSAADVTGTAVYRTNLTCMVFRERGSLLSRSQSSDQVEWYEARTNRV